MWISTLLEDINHLFLFIFSLSRSFTFFDKRSITLDIWLLIGSSLTHNKIQGNFYEYEVLELQERVIYRKKSYGVDPP